MPLKTKRWDEPREADDGFRLLVCRFRPRGVSKADETWDAWEPELGPSAELHAAAYGKGRIAVSWAVYRSRYLSEMREQKGRIAEWAKRLAAGETITLLCSSQCVVESRCHRSLLAGLIERAAAASPPAEGEGQSAGAAPPSSPSPTSSI